MRSHFKIRCCFLALLTVLGFVTAGRADFIWFNSSTNLMYYSNGTTPLFGVNGDDTVSCFIQLIYSGINDQIEVADVTQTQGTTGDDLVVAWSYVAANVPGIIGSTSHYGRVSNLDPVDEVPGGMYYVRTWTEPSPDFLNGSVPLSGTNFYGNSQLFEALAGYDPPAEPQNVNFGGADGIIANLSPVPEPRTFLLALMGLCSLCRWVRRANSIR